MDAGLGVQGAGPLDRDQEVFYRKVLSDRRQEGGGLAVLSKTCRRREKWLKPSP
jgi:hypothetical protein